MSENVPVAFVASASEGLNVVEAVMRLLHSALAGVVEVRLWTHEFQLSKAYIESLERVLDDSDFGILVLSPDDRITSRGSEHFAPRDNVVFELGLFFGRLGRDRCFFMHPTDVGLKLPSDLLGVEPATFSLTSAPALDDALEPACRRIAEAIRHAVNTLPSRPKAERFERAAQGQIRAFNDRIRGMWWERILLKGERPAMSFLCITEDRIHNSVRLTGSAYDADGAHVAEWRSASARLEADAESGKLVYVRECRRFDDNATTTAWLPGLAEVAFRYAGTAVEQGTGRFWESEESRPELTIIKSVELRRCHDTGDAAAMNRGSIHDRRAVAVRVLNNW